MINLFVRLQTCLYATALAFLFLFPSISFGQTGNPRTAPSKPYCVFYKNGKLAYLQPGSNGQVIKMVGDTSVTWAADASGAITDGTYGDISVSGVTWTIVNGAVSAAKLAAGAVSDSSKVAANAIRTTQIANGAVWPSKINQAGANTDQYLRWNGTTWVPTFPFSGANERIPFFSGNNTITNSGGFRWVNSSQQLEINTAAGNTTWATMTGGSGTANVSLRSGNPANATVIPGGSVVFSRAGTTPNTGNASTTADYLGSISAQAFYGGLFREASCIQFRGDSSASTFYAGNISLHTSDGTGAVIERMRIDRAGDVGIGTINPIYRLDIAGSGAIRISSGTTVQEPAGAVGVLRHNTTTGSYRGVRSGSTYENFVMSVGSSSLTTALREESFTATAAQTSFTIAVSQPAVSGSSVPVRVYRNGIRLAYVASGPTFTQFTYSGTTVTTAANALGDLLVVEYLH